MKIILPCGFCKRNAIIFALQILLYSVLRGGASIIIIIDANRTCVENVANSTLLILHAEISMEIRLRLHSAQVY